jgi:predicted nucleic acid-binding protein
VRERIGRAVFSVMPFSDHSLAEVGLYLSHLDLGGNSVGRQSDALLASQARELGWVVVTRDRDFESLRAKITGLRVAAPYPER